MEFIFSLIIGILIFADYKLYKTTFTPFTILSGTYLLLVLLNNFGAVKLGFFEVKSSSIGYLLYFIMLIYAVSIFFYFVFHIKHTTSINKIDRQRYVELVILNQTRRKQIVVTFILGLLAKYLSLIQAISQYGIENIKGKAEGIYAHIGNIGLVLTPYIMVLFIREKKLTYLLLILMMYVNLFYFGGKYGLIIAMLHLTILYAMIYDVNPSKTIKIALLILLFVVAVFIVIYAIIPSLRDDSLNKQIFVDRLLFSLTHFLFYLVSPVIATNYYFSNMGSGNVELLFTVPINIIRGALGIGGYLNSINTKFMQVHTYYATNVGGLFAEAAYESNLLFASVYVILFFTFVYYFFSMAIYQAKMISLAALSLSVVMMMFFGNFLTVSGVVLQLIFLFVIEFLFNNTAVKNKKIYRRYKNE